MLLALFTLLQLLVASIAAVLSGTPVVQVVPEGELFPPSPPRNVGAMPENPAIYVYGHGPTGERCGTCYHLGAERPEAGPTEYSCQLQADRTKVTWDACAAYVAEPAPR